MDHDYAQRRRVALAIAITVIAVPVAVLLGRDSGGTDATTTTPPLVGTFAPAGSGPVAPTAPGNDEPAEFDPFGTVPDELGGDTVPTADTHPAQIAVPILPESIRGAATFSSAVPSLRLCQADGVPFNATLTVMNLDNSKRVSCIASIVGLDLDADVVLNADAFAEIADLTDAPVPVEITWTGP